MFISSRQDKEKTAIVRNGNLIEYTGSGAGTFIVLVFPNSLDGIVLWEKHSVHSVGKLLKGLSDDYRLYSGTLTLSNEAKIL